MRILALVILFSVSTIGYRQNSGNPKFGNWIMYFGQIRFHENWSVHHEVQLRDFKTLDELEQLLLRFGINYHKNGILYTGGYGKILNYNPDDNYFGAVQANENRIWQQLFFKNKINRLHLDHRIRLEQRWIDADESTLYKNRFRYFIRLNYPLSTDAMNTSNWFLSFYNEVFLNLSDSLFDRNRIYLALGHQFSPKLSLQLGILNQFTSKDDKYNLQIGLTHTLDFRPD